MRFSKDKIEELKEKVRVELVKNPNAGIYRIQNALQKAYGHIFDKNFVAKLKRKVHRERAGAWNQNIYTELGQLENIVICARPILADIVFDEDKNHKPSDRIKAFQAIMNMGFILFDAKRNAGIFEKRKEPETKLTPDEVAELNKIIEKVFRVKPPQGVESTPQ